MKRILTGLQPSGELTLGSLLGGINQSIKYQDEFESFIFMKSVFTLFSFTRHACDYGTSRSKSIKR